MGSRPETPVLLQNAEVAFFIEESPFLFACKAALDVNFDQNSHNIVNVGLLQCGSPYVSGVLDYGKLWVQAGTSALSLRVANSSYNLNMDMMKSVHSDQFRLLCSGYLLICLSQWHFSCAWVKTPEHCDCRGVGATTGRKTLRLIYRFKHYQAIFPYQICRE